MTSLEQQIADATEQYQKLLALCSDLVDEQECQACRDAARRKLAEIKRLVFVQQTEAEKEIME